jgi:hypothetical protein
MDAITESSLYLADDGTYTCVAGPQWSYYAPGKLIYAVVKVLKSSN